MKKIRFRSTTLTALILILAIVLSLAIGFLTPFTSVYANSYTPSTIFSSGTGGSVGVSDEDGEGNSYVRFAYSVSSGGSVYFRRDLALKWYSSLSDEEAEEETSLANPGKLNYFSMEFAFDGFNFTTFTLTFEAAEENISKDETSSNSVVFTNDDGAVTVAVRDSSLAEESDWKDQAVSYEVDVTDGVVFSIDEDDCEIGEFCVYINGTYVGTMTNIGGYYLEYLSSASDTPRIPISFVVDSLTDSNTPQYILMKEINGQSFLLDEEGKVEDNAAPVLVVNEKIYAYTLGKKWSLTYEAIDVCDTSVSVNRYYYMLPESEAKADDDDYSSLTTNTFLMPADDLSEEEEQYISVRFQLEDDSGITDSEDEYIYLTWYAAENAVVTKGSGDDAFDYILVNRNEVGPYYLGITANEETLENDVDSEAEEAAEAYQEAVYEAAEGLSAGSGAYFYLPSLRGLIGSDYADYRNLTFTIYYYKQSQEADASASSEASLAYNELKFEIDEVGRYLFCVLAVDASSNAMMYYVDGELVEITSSNVWDVDEIPKFTFTVSYSGATVEDAGEQTLGYRDSSYSISSFDIVALDGYETEYALYYLDEEAMEADGVDAPYSSYTDFVENINEYYDIIKDYLIEISEYNSDVDEDDDAWDRTDNDYYWYPDSLTFTPVEVGYYIVELKILESSLPGNVVTAYQVIDVRNPIDSPPDVSEWLQNNVLSVVLFSISAVLAIIIVILFVMKSPEESIDEVDLAKLKKMESRKKGVMKNQQKQKKSRKKTSDGETGDEESDDEEPDGGDE